MGGCCGGEAAGRVWCGFSRFYSSIFTLTTELCIVFCCQTVDYQILICKLLYVVTIQNEAQVVTLLLVYTVTESHIKQICMTKAKLMALVKGTALREVD